MFNDLIDRATNYYHVNPAIFVALYLLSFVPYYVGVFQMAKGLIKRDGRAIWRGAALNRFGWALPYLYVLIAGRNLPLWITLALVALIIIEVAIGFNRRRQKRIVKLGNDLLGLVAGWLLKLIPPRIMPARPDQMQAALELEYRVFRMLGYTESSKNHQIDDYAKYLDQSAFFVAVWCGKIIGVLRLIRTGHNAPPVLKEFDIDPKAPKYAKMPEFEEVGIVAVSSFFINAEVGKLLYRAAWQDARRRGVRYWGAVIEKWLLDIFNNRYHFPFRQFGTEKYYMGAVVYPVVMDLQEAEEIYQRDYPKDYEWFRRAS